MAVTDVWLLAADGPDVTPLPVMAPTGLTGAGWRRPFFEVDRKPHFGAIRTVVDPERTWGPDTLISHHIEVP